MPDDFIYTVNQVAIILNKSDKTVRTYIAEGALESTKKIEERSGIEKVFISAASLASLIEKKALRVNFDALEEYSPNLDVVQRLFQRPGETREEPAHSRPEMALLPTASNSSDESLVVEILKEQLGKLEAEKEELKRDLKEKDRQLEEKNLALIAVTRENSESYQLIALAKEQVEARLARLSANIRILHLSTNRDIRRLQEGKLGAADLSLLPVDQVGEYEASSPEEGQAPSSPAKKKGESRASVEATPSPIPSQAEEEPATAREATPELEPLPPSPPTRKRQGISKPKKSRPKQSSGKKPEAEPARPKRGFFRRLFGG